MSDADPYLWERCTTVFACSGADMKAWKEKKPQSGKRRYENNIV